LRLSSSLAAILLVGPLLLFFVFSGGSFPNTPALQDCLSSQCLEGHSFTSPAQFLSARILQSPVHSSSIEALGIFFSFPGRQERERALNPYPPLPPLFHSSPPLSLLSLHLSNILLPPPNTVTDGRRLKPWTVSGPIALSPRPSVDLNLGVPMIPGSCYDGNRHRVLYSLF